MFQIRIARSNLSVQPRLRPITIVRHFGASPNTNTYTPEELSSARAWLAQFNPTTIPHEICSISFSRSSGPGGQKVNKTSSKATLRVPLSALLPLVPPILHPAIRNSRYHAARSEELVIQSDEARKQGDNSLACFRRLSEMILQAGKDTVPGETTPEQSKRVAELQKAEAAGRRRIKEAQSKKKSARRVGRGDE